MNRKIIGKTNAEHYSPNKTAQFMFYDQTIYRQRTKETK
jgi:hypothetical protein